MPTEKSGPSEQFMPATHEVTDNIHELLVALSSIHGQVTTLKKYLCGTEEPEPAEDIAQPNGWIAETNVMILNCQEYCAKINNRLNEILTT